jgi:hypothetical protein
VLDLIHAPRRAHTTGILPINAWVRVYHDDAVVAAARR